MQTRRDGPFPGSPVKGRWTSTLALRGIEARSTWACSVTPPTPLGARHPWWPAPLPGVAWWDTPASPLIPPAVPGHAARPFPLGAGRALRSGMVDPRRWLSAPLPAVTDNDSPLRGVGPGTTAGPPTDATMALPSALSPR